MWLRRLLRRYVPFEVRLRVRLLRRWGSDQRRGLRFAREFAEAATFPHIICSYGLPYIDYPGQEQWSFAKRRNQALLAEKLNGLVIQPGETFSLWQTAGRPLARDGYLPAAALKDHEMTAEVGGSVCFLSTILYNIGLLGALRIEERYCHSIDSYGDRRYFELARDASVEYGYRDLRLRNPHPFPVLVEIDATRQSVTAYLRATQTVDFVVEIEVGTAEVLHAGWQVRVDPAIPPSEQRILREPLDGLRVTARRIIRYHDRPAEIESLPESFHRPLPGQLVVGASSASAEQRRTPFE